MKGVKVSASEELSQVLFVDDNIQSFIIILYLYKKEIGMQINIKKSNLSYNKISTKEVSRLKEVISFPLKPISEGFKYIGFVLNLNSYSFYECIWLYKKVEARLSWWTNWFLSRGGRLVLLIAVLLSLPIYRISISYIPKGILTKVRNNFFSFLQTARKQDEGIPLVIWSILSNPQGTGGLMNKKYGSIMQILR